MEHEERAKDILMGLLCEAMGFAGPRHERLVDEFFIHLKRAVAINNSCRCECPNRPQI